MPIVSHFPFMKSDEAAKPEGIWGWAKRMVEALQRWKPFDLMDTPIAPYNIMRVNAAGDAWELGLEELGLAGQVLTGLAKQIIRVKDTEDGYLISKEVLHTLVGLSLAGKGGYIIRVNIAETGFLYDKEVMESLRGVSLAGKAGQFIKVNLAETGFEIAP